MTPMISKTVQSLHTKETLHYKVEFAHIHTTFINEEKIHTLNRHTRVSTNKLKQVYNLNI